MLKGLIVVGTTVIGAGIGGSAGLIAAMFWADMDLGSLGGVEYVLGGIAVGAVAGAYIGGQLV